MQNFYNLILAGGSGTRLWPLSRETYPKQFINFFGEKSLFQDTCLRDKLHEKTIIATGENHRFSVLNQLKQIGLDAEILVEPDIRDTFPIILLSALYLNSKDPESIMLVLASDHIIKDADKFNKIISSSIPAAEAGYFVTFGIKPDSPNTGYGYIEKSDKLELGKGEHNCYKVKQFHEKPDKVKAEEYLSQGDCFWNSGIFLFKTESFLKKIKETSPDLYSLAEKNIDALTNLAEFKRFNKELFCQFPKISIDYAYLEKADNVAVSIADIDWNDLGSYESLHDVADKDQNNNFADCELIAKNSTNLFIKQENKGKLVATIGVSDLIIIDTNDALLIAKQGDSGSIKALVNQLKSVGDERVKYHSLNYRPWGKYVSLVKGDHFQVKEITVYPGGLLSLQYHHYRSEHWIVVEGTAKVEIDGKISILNANQSIYIPKEVRHRLTNETDQPLKLIEVQTGDKIDEDDIVRLEDIYGR
jgi:mannose-1-phosphate guanylyltransferase/mannose-6-phosphate isomerase